MISSDVEAGRRQIGRLAAESLGQLHRAVEVGAGQQDGELVAAQPRDQVAGPHAAGEQRGDLSQRLVAAGVAVAVVDLLEVVDVEEDDADDGAGAGGPRCRR